MLTLTRSRDLALAMAALTAFSVGFEYVQPSITFSDDLRLTNLRLVLALALALWLLSCARTRRWPRLPRVVGLPVVLWLVALQVSAMLAAAFQMQALNFVRDIALGVAFGWATYDLARTHRESLVLARAVALCATCVALVGLAEAARLQPVVDFLQGFRYQPSFNIGEVMRVTSTLTHPNIAAMLLGVAVPLQVAWIVTSRSNTARALLCVGLSAELATVVLTISRTGAAVTELVLGLMLVAGVLRHEALLIRVSAVAAVVLPLLLGAAIVRQPILLLHLTGETVQNWYRVDYSPPGTVTAPAGQAAVVPIRLENRGERVWSAAGAYPFALSYHLSQADGTPVTYDGLRTALPWDVPPGGALDLQAAVVAPPTPGTYLLEWDEVQEHVTWFSWAGSPPAVTYLKVGDPPSNGQAQATEVIRSTPPPATLAPQPATRLDQWRMALQMARERPLLGVGPDNFRWVYGEFAGLPTWDTGGHANSVYFEFLADTGVIGLGLFLWIAWLLLRTSFRSILLPRGIRSETRDAAWIWQLAFAGSLSAWFLHGVLDYFYEPLPTNVAFWLLAGLALAAADRVGRDRVDAAACASRST